VLRRSSDNPSQDVKFDNGGVVHVIDSVLSIPTDVATTATAAGLTTLARSLVQAELLATVNTLKDVTIFAPTNAAFRALTRNGGRLPRGAALADVLTYHVVNGTVAYSTLLENGQEVPTVNGGSLKITLVDGKVKVNNATVVQADVLVKNGVVHVIDSVLTPA